MQVVSDFSGDTHDGQLTQLNLEEFSEESKEKVLMYGFNSTTSQKLHSLYNNYPNRYLYDMASATIHYATNQGKDYNDLVQYFSEIFCTCPYTMRWYNKLYQDKVRYIAMCINEKLIPKSFEKHHDVCYVGCIADRLIQECIDVISRFSYRFVTKREIPDDMKSDKITDVKVGLQKKLDIVAECKICVCYNMLFLEPRHLKVFNAKQNIASYEPYQLCMQSAGRYPTYKANIPQFKMRCHEAAMGKTLILCQRDPWNMIEDYYEPDKEFVYFDNNEVLEDKIKEILDNWDHFQKVAEAAYQKMLTYYTRLPFIKAIANNEPNWATNE